MNVHKNLSCKKAGETYFYNILYAKQMLMLLWIFHGVFDSM